MKKMHMVAFLLVIVGGLNWGLVGLGNLLGNPTDSWNVVRMVLGSGSLFESIVYLLVGLSALVLVFGHKRDCRMCGQSGM